MKSRPNILTISGFDPSNGAGLTADVKTMESLKCYALSICSAVTVQNDVELESCTWTPVEVMKKQIDLLAARFDFEWVKVGIVENWSVLLELLEHIQKCKPQVRVVLDPVLKSSSSYVFQDPDQEEQWEGLLDQVYLLTPNYEEIEQLYPQLSIVQTLEKITSKTSVYLKGGHRSDHPGKDELHLTDGKQFNLNPKNNKVSEKHGSGCVLASSITAYLALGYPLLKACFRGKMYTERILASNNTLLGYHG